MPYDYEFSLDVPLLGYVDAVTVPIPSSYDGHKRIERKMVDVRFESRKKTTTASLFRTSRKILQNNLLKLRNTNEFTFVFMGDGWAGDGQTSNTIFGLALSAVRSLKRTAKEFKTGGTYTDKVPVKSLLQLINYRTFEGVITELSQ
ncbi:hypothetical protein P5G65_07115 [Paenibacillus chondroitinus]|uniref:Uncharacterized protein n=1 Tax=Paenibacillus chondroitinus TaxID=59842 RepID=A0ABU6D7G9_9BACL|nr:MULTISPECIES: hypothetical protein [Paenibacillus]MCY9661974.1 hypothetical protein [Paenibacillus anseongense]MEB4793660.1 hypothetical protein [Paenibacillus chondroitinus]